MADPKVIAARIARAKQYEAGRTPSPARKPELEFDRDRDELLDLKARDYVRVLADVDIPERGRALCPLPGSDERRPNLSVVRENDTRWYCFGCGRGGSIYDFAGHLWGMGTRGAAFAELRDAILGRLAR